LGAAGVRAPGGMSPFGAAESSAVSDLYALARGAATWKSGETSGAGPAAAVKASAGPLFRCVAIEKT
jgi:hypothetical protein